MIGRTAAVLIALLLLVTATATARADVTSFGDEPGTLRLPEAVAFAPNGDLLVGDHFGGRVQRFRDGRFVGAFGLRGEGCGRLGAIGGVAADRQGNVYVLDTDQQLVQVFDASGASVRCFGGKGTAPGRLSTTSGSYAASSASGGIAVSDNYIYVADTGNDRVQRFTLAGKDPKVLGGRGVLDQPQGLAVSGTRLLVADDVHHRVVELSTTSGKVINSTTSTRVRLRYPYDVALDAAGRAYVADNNLHRVVVLDRHLRQVHSWGSFGHARGQFVYPRAVAIAPGDHHVLVADAGNDRVQEFGASGGFVRSIGINGRATPRMTSPADVAVNALGEVAVGDGNGRISWYDVDGTFRGAWAQSKSFQQSTAVVAAPSGIAFAGDRSLRVADSGSVRAFAAGSVATLLGGAGAATSVSSVDVGPSGTVWAAQGQGPFARVPDGGASPRWLGAKGAAGRTTTAVAELADGTVALAEGTSPHQRDPRDGTVARYDATSGRLLSTWAIPRPPGGQPSRPGGLAAAPDGGIWVTDAANDVVLELDASGAIVTRLGAPGTGAGQLAGPRGLTLDCGGGLLVADAGNNRVVRFGGVTTATGCGSAARRPTASGRPPGPVGLKLRTLHRAAKPARVLGTLRATCARPCTLATSDATIGTFVNGRPKQVPLTVVRSGSTIKLMASPSALAALRVAVRHHDAFATASIVVTATSRDGVVDTATIAWSYR